MNFIKAQTTSNVKPIPSTKRYNTNPIYLTSKLFDLHVPHLTSQLHLQIEAALWLCTFLLTMASSHVLYKDSYLKLHGDWSFIFWVSLWLGRHYLIRWVCTITYIDTYNDWRGHYGGSWKRRKAFQTWLHKQQAKTSLYHRIRWLFSLCSPYNITCAVVKWIQSCAMAGQYCDTSAAHGVASAALMNATGGGSGGGGSDHDHHHHHHSHHHHHHGSKGSMSHGHSGFGPYPSTNDVHSAVILSLARSW